MINCAHRHCMHGLIEIHTGSKIIGNILIQLGKISGNFLPVLNFWKIYNPNDK